MKRSSSILFVDAILSIFLFGVPGILILSKVPDAEDTVGAIGGFIIGISAIACMLMVVFQKNRFAKYKIDKDGVTQKFFRKTYFLAWEDCAECTLLVASENPGCRVINFCATTVPLTPKERKEFFRYRATRKHDSDTIFFNICDEDYELLMAYLPEHLKKGLRIDAIRLGVLDSSCRPQ